MGILRAYYCKGITVAILFVSGLPLFAGLLTPATFAVYLTGSTDAFEPATCRTSTAAGRDA